MRPVFVQGMLTGRITDLVQQETPEMLKRLVDVSGDLTESLKLRRQLTRESKDEITEEITALGKQIEAMKALQTANENLAKSEADLQHLREHGVLPTGERPLFTPAPTPAKLDVLGRKLITAQQRIGKTLGRGIADSMVLAVTDGASRIDKLQVWNRVGQNIGDQIGQAVATKMIGKITAETTLMQIASGNIIGGLISGGIGILSQLLFPVDDPLKEEVRAQEDNTSAIRELTDEFRSFTERFINAPATFALGQTRAVGTAGGGGGAMALPPPSMNKNSFSFVINQQPGQSGKDVAQEVARIFDGYGGGEEFSIDLTS